MSRRWDEREHPRNPNDGQFVDKWVGQLSNAIGSAIAGGSPGGGGSIDPEFAAARERHGQYLFDVLDSIRGVEEHADDPVWLAHHRKRLQTHLERRLPREFEHDPRAYAAQRRVAALNAVKNPLPWDTYLPISRDDMAAVYPFWRDEIARLIRREGYDSERLLQFLDTGGGRWDSESAYFGGSSRETPEDVVSTMKRRLEDLAAGRAGLASLVSGQPDPRVGQSQAHLYNAERLLGTRMEGEHGGRLLRGADLDEHPDFATSGDFEIWYDGAWRPLEEVYRDDPDEEEVGVIAGDHHFVLDTSDEVEVRQTQEAQYRHRAWWE